MPVPHPSKLNMFTRRICTPFLATEINMGGMENIYRHSATVLELNEPVFSLADRRVYLYRPGKWNPDKASFNDVFCFGAMLCELVGLEPKTQIAGVTTIADAGGFGFKQFRQFGIEDAKNSAAFIQVGGVNLAVWYEFCLTIHLSLGSQDCFPLWFRAMHVVNAPRFFNMAYLIIKPFLKEEVKNSITFHSSLESLHEHVCPEILPQVCLVHNNRARYVVKKAFFAPCCFVEVRAAPLVLYLEDPPSIG